MVTGRVVRKGGGGRSTTTSFELCSEEALVYRRDFSRHV
jgi:hypothetical protein